MTIETKANNGDIVYYMKDNKVTYGEVFKTHIAVSEEQGAPAIGIHYMVTGSHQMLLESQIFHSKEELLKSL